MIHLFGINIDSKKNIPDALSSVYGIGGHKIHEVCAQLGINKKYRIYQLSNIQLSRMCQFVEDNYFIESDLRKKEAFHIKRLLDIKSYRGLRHVSGLPLRGQRTHTNAKTQKRLAKRRSLKTMR